MSDGISRLHIVNDVIRPDPDSDWTAELMTDDAIDISVRIGFQASEERARGIVHEMVRPREEPDG